MRNVAFLRGRVPTESAPRPTDTHTTLMQQRLDAPAGRAQYGRRFATVEPVFVNIRYDKRLDRFTLRDAHQGQSPVAAVLPGAQH